MTKSCSVIKCKSRFPDQKRFYHFPKTNYSSPHLKKLAEERADKWQKALRFKELPKYVYVCSKHFVSGESAKLTDVDNIDWVPSVNMGYRTINAGTVAKMNRRVRYQARCETKKNGLQVEVKPELTLHDDVSLEEEYEDDQRVRSSEFETDEEDDDESEVEATMPTSHDMMDKATKKPLVITLDTNCCRMCLQEDDSEKKSVFSFDHNGHKISDMILTCFKIMINPKDKYLMICGMCTYKVKKMFSWYNEFMTNYTKLTLINQKLIRQIVERPQHSNTSKPQKNGHLSATPSTTKKQDLQVVEDNEDPLSIPQMSIREISDDESTLDAFDLDGQEIEPPIKKPKTIVTSTPLPVKMKKTFQIGENDETQKNLSSKVILKMRKGNDFIHLPIILDPSKAKQLVVIKHISEKWLNPEKVNMVPLDKKSTMFKEPLKVTVIDKERALKISNEIKARKALVASDHDYSFEEETEKEVRKGLGIPVDKQFTENEATANVYIDPSLKCFICNQMHEDEKELIKHFMRHSQKVPYRCVICHSTFPVFFDLHEHMKCHNKDRPLKCLDCNQYFLSKSSLNSHVFSHHKSNSNKDLDVEK